MVAHNDNPSTEEIDRQEAQKFKVILGYTRSWRPAQDTWDSIFKNSSLNFYVFFHILHIHRHFMDTGDGQNQGKFSFGNGLLTFFTKKSFNLGNRTFFPHYLIYWCSAGNSAVASCVLVNWFTMSYIPGFTYLFIYLGFFEVGSCL